MALLAPPPAPPRLFTAADDNLRRLQFRLWQLFISALTIFLTVWCFTLGPVPGVVAVLVAKHVLVAVLAIGLDLHPALPPDN